MRLIIISNFNGIWGKLFSDFAGCFRVATADRCLPQVDISGRWFTQNC